MELVRRTLSLSNQPSLTETELAQRAVDWQDTFEAEIPLSRLMDAFNAALRVHTGTFPVNAFEVLDAWRSLDREECNQAKANRDRQKYDSSNLPCVPMPDHVEKALNQMLGKMELK
jgi:hypothetical protein